MANPINGQSMPSDDYVLNFGKHKGKTLDEAPADYLLYLYDQGICFGELKNYIKAYREELEERKVREAVK